MAKELETDSTSRLVITYGGQTLFDGDVDTIQCTLTGRPSRRYYEERMMPVPPATVELKATLEQA